MIDGKEMILLIFVEFLDLNSSLLLV